MTYKLRVILDVEEDVFRDLIVGSTINLEELHFTIARSFGFKGQEMASFYRSNHTWDQGEEIPLFDMSENGDALSMKNCKMTNVLKNIGDKLIYVYDFFSMWTFFVELSEIKDDIIKQLPIVALSFGNVPDTAPEKEFRAEDTINDINFFDDEGTFDNIDDMDF